MSGFKIDLEYMKKQLKGLVEIPSPSGYTDTIVHYVGKQLQILGVDFELTRRGAIRANLKGTQESPDRAIVVHLDTVGAMVRQLKPNGRLAIAPIGSWPSRSAEGVRVSILTKTGSLRGTVLPLKASGHTFGDQVNTQPVNWDQLEIRVDEDVNTDADLIQMGIQVGDFLAIEPGLEILENGYIVSRHLDDKAGVAVVLSVIKAIQENKIELSVDCHFLFTISEEVGSGASAVLHQDVAEMVSIDNATSAQGQNSIEHGVTVGMMDSTGPFDWHLTHLLIELCEKNGIPFARDVFRYYRCDAASAVEAGNDLRTGLVCFGLDASHGYERTHIHSLEWLTRLILFYVQSEPCVKHDRYPLGPLTGFPKQPT